MPEASHFLNNNCVEVAYGSWNYAMPPKKKIVGSTFPYLEKLYLSTCDGSFIFDMNTVLELKY